jgi:glutathione S-transferase
MALTLYAGSGSPWVWRVWLALEHKALPYDLKMLSFSAGDTRKPEFVALNPRHRVPTLVDGDFVLYESNPIVEYLDEAYPGRGQPLFPGDARERAIVRRLIAEIDNYLDKATDPWFEQVFYKKPEERDAAALAKATEEVKAELAMLARAMRGDFLAGPLSAADYALYPLVAFFSRAKALKMPELDLDALLPPALRSWKARIEALPYFEKTVPPHWKAKG